MGVLQTFTGWLGKVAGTTPDPADDFYYEPIAPTGDAGIRVTPDIALKASAVYACVKVLAETIATLPLNIMRETPDGRVKANDHPIAELVRFQPNSWQTAVEFWEMMILHAALRGTGYAEIVPGARGAVDQLKPLHTDRVRPERLRDGTWRFKATNEQTGETRTFLQEELFRIPGMSSDGIQGMRAIDLAADAIGLGMAADRYAGRVFRNNLNIGTALIHPKKLSPDAQKNLIDALMRRFAGAHNAHRPMVLWEDMKVQQVGQTAEQAQLIEARKWQIGEIARFWRIPLHMLGIDDQTNRSTVEEQSLNFVRYTLRPWVKRIEQAARRDLIVAKGTYMLDFNMEGLLRGNAAARAGYFSAALGASGRAAWMTPNEIREIEGKNRSDDPRADVLGGMLPQEATPAQNSGQAMIEAQPSAADKLVRKETVAIRKATQRFAGDVDGLQDWIRAFYGGHVSSVMDALGIPKEAARAYCEHQRDMALQAGDLDALLNHWESNLASEINRTLEAKGYAGATA